MRAPLRWSSIASVVLASLAPTALRAEDAAPPAAPAWKPGAQEGAVSIDGQEEKFSVLVPSGYSPKKPCPAVLLLHGSGGKAADALAAVKPHLGKSPCLLIAPQRPAEEGAAGYPTKFLEALKTPFAIEAGKVFAIGIAGGAARLWEDVLAKPEEAARFRGIVLVGAGKQASDPGDKPASAPTVVLVGDPKEEGFKESGPAAEKALKEKGYDVVVLEHNSGAAPAAPEWKEVLGWIDAVVAGRPAALRTRRADEIPAGPLPAWKKGEQEGVVQIDGQAEKFVALVPNGYSPKKPLPAVLLLHGNGGTAANFLQSVKSNLGKSPLLLIALERCDNQQKAEGYAPKYLRALRGVFAIDPAKVFALGFSGGGFRLWDDVVCKAEEAARFRGIVLVGSARQNFDPQDKPAPAPTIVLVGDPKDSNFTQTGPAAEKALTEKGYEVIVLEHNGGHSMPAPEMKDVFAWIDALVAGKKTALASHRLADDKKK